MPGAEFGFNAEGPGHPQGLQGTEEGCNSVKSWYQWEPAWGQEGLDPHSPPLLPRPHTGRSNPPPGSGNTHFPAGERGAHGW